MFRTIFTPSRLNNNIPFAIPNEWYGQLVEVIAFPIGDADGQAQKNFTMQEKGKKREELNKILDEYPLNLSGFKFNREEANEYD
jgi:hypothetical protein